MTRETIGVDDRPFPPMWVVSRQKQRLYHKRAWWRRGQGWMNGATYSGGANG